jgi:hypothetical protein
MVAVLVLFTTSGDVADIVTLTTLSDKGIVDVRFLSPTALDDSVAEFSVSNDPFFEACKLVCSTSEKVLFRGKGHFEGKVRIGVKGGKFVVLPES